MLSMLTVEFRESKQISFLPNAKASPPLVPTTGSTKETGKPGEGFHIFSSFSTSEEDSFAPRFYFDLSCLSHQEWRASHAISHHLHTNSLTDVEVDVNNRKQKLSFLDIGSEPN